MLVAKFKDHILAIQKTDGNVEVTRKQELVLEMQLGKRKRTHDMTLLATSMQLDVAMPSAGSARGHDTFVKGGGSHEPVCCKFKCDRCKRKGHVR